MSSIADTWTGYTVGIGLFRPVAIPINNFYLFQVTAAVKRGAIGAILYVDPDVVAQEGTDSKHTYPNTPWVSKTAVFSKKLIKRNGDLLTPNLPSITGMYRRRKNETDLPSIPAQPISYGDALNLLSRLRGAFATSFPGSFSPSPQRRERPWERGWYFCWYSNDTTWLSYG